MVGETMTQDQSWRDHIREAYRLLALATAGADRAKSLRLSCLYDAVVEITQALNQLETAGNGKKEES
jgi:hypothetical protein